LLAVIREFMDHSISPDNLAGNFAKPQIARLYSVNCSRHRFRCSGLPEPIWHNIKEIPPIHYESRVHAIPRAWHPEEQFMTRVLLTILAMIEAALGLLGLVSIANVFFAHSAELALFFLPVLAIVALMLLASAAIFVRRPWTYYTHIVAIILACLILLYFANSILAGDVWYAAVLAIALAVPLTALFLLPSVRRYFGVIA
jgi:hypothetical protein